MTLVLFSGLVDAKAVELKRREAKRPVLSERCFEEENFIDAFNCALLRAIAASLIVLSLAQFGQDSTCLSFLSRRALSSSIPAIYDPNNSPIQATPKYMKIEQMILFRLEVGTKSP